MSSTASFPTAVGSVLAACEDVASTPRQGQAAFLTWCQGQAKGWPSARALVAQRSWFRHLAILREAGAPGLPSRRSRSEELGPSKAVRHEGRKDRKRWRRSKIGDLSLSEMRAFLGSRRLSTAAVAALIEDQGEAVQPPCPEALVPALVGLSQPGLSPLSLPGRFLRFRVDWQSWQAGEVVRVYSVSLVRDGEWEAVLQPWEFCWPDPDPLFEVLAVVDLIPEGSSEAVLPTRSEEVAL
jgi:hypothetical protein